MVAPTCLPAVLRRCHKCSAERFRTTGKFRVNANHKLLDVWLLALCTGCGDTTKLTVLDRAHVRSVRPDLLDRLHANDLSLAGELLQEPAVRRRNRIALDWDCAWHLDTGKAEQPEQPEQPESPKRPDGEAIEVSVHFAARIPVRPLRLIAEGFGLSRAEVGRLLAEGGLVSAVRLSGKLSDDFTFLLKR
ncbi:DUF1062 domain-containing protein [Streptomyces sp. NBC_00237]|uniref:DUF1062 domain-containing protein n=1 Tax=Streptomyces sp. NBC_00237 TaxID=2975687 RepID=UPI00225972A7|nr:DUF1062 domain-containing protein [Streptomyces sp. NBC_00237]MCX5206569.1 DUF1062 domain-containing protein [Streptomyces sp. NBC_00237]